MMHQAFGGDTQVAAERVVTAEVQCLVQKTYAQLGAQLLIKPPALGEELRTVQVAMQNKLLLVQSLNALQHVLDLPQSTLKHVLAHPHRLAGAIEHPGNLTDVLHHEVSFFTGENRQGLPRLFGHHDQFVFQRAAGMPTAWAAQHKYLARLETIWEGRIQALQ
ncbi:hypothetical protein D3C76_1314830 [compost metagenome]